MARVSNFFRLTVSVFPLCGLIFAGPPTAVDTSTPFYEQILQALTGSPARDRVIPWRRAGVDDTALLSNQEASVPPQRQYDWNIVLDWSKGDEKPCMYSGEVDFSQLGRGKEPGAALV